MEANVTRDSVLALIHEKEKIENEISQFKSVLDRNSVGMTEALVDDCGYPRQDIDVYQVRDARHKIICLMNDLKGVMLKIEQNLHILHGQQREGVGLPVDPSTSAVQHTEPIARVNFVAPHSPAEEAGICVEDLIVEFGSVNAGNLKSLQDISTVVQHTQGRSVSIRVKRHDKMVRLSLTPHVWSGRGLLGCNIIPVETVER
ncbi:26S proteasome non-ATPase regulatory subunit 9 [Zootermopsis nevadensis]|uniref:26S proteasome non-ATPase regulatory subunit 9 n=1 Tax=Zootermopsis nevadensis TaxID=136037 RepID=A0A067QHC4_ZOONE|nr:26S proteasome non-ATPase regulatory subunit 9 [Zootermopsis nevadensis]KDR07730.1 26S proteasome non-ATPase regulatory subunit 9 [Zootermopsis nevadensis]